MEIPTNEELARKLAQKVAAVSLPADKRKQLIFDAIKGNWTQEQFRFERTKAKFLHYLDGLAFDDYEEEGKSNG